MHGLYMHLSYVINFPDVQSYLQFCENPDLSLLCPQTCNHCGRRQPLQSHGSYPRNVWCANGLYKIEVFRFRCGNCGSTVSVLPSFVGRYQRFAWDLQEQVLATCEKGASLEQAGEQVQPPSGPVSARTVWRWRKTWRSWMEALESKFWNCLLFASPFLVLPCGKARPPTQFERWKQLWQEVSPMGMTVHLFHGLFRLRQSQDCVHG